MLPIVCRHVHSRVCRHAPRMCRARLESSRRGGHFEYRHVYPRAIDMPSAMADVGHNYITMPSAMADVGHNYMTMPSAMADVGHNYITHTDGADGKRG